MESYLSNYENSLVFFLSVFCLSSCVMVTSYIVMTTYFWHDSTLVTPLVFEELTTRLTGPAYPANDFQVSSLISSSTTKVLNPCV